MSILLDEGTVEKLYQWFKCESSLRFPRRLFVQLCVLECERKRWAAQCQFGLS
jgi:hypothetical protein